MLTKFTYMSKIHSRQRLNCILTERKKMIKKLKNSKTFIDYSQTIDDVYENVEDYNPPNKKKVLIVFDDMTVL